MPEIQVLPPHLADLIAAGEVVERPGSVLKELLENAIDAGAKNITAEIRGGGLTYIRVTDDGCGMSPEDAGVAFLRHATSKLRDEGGLEAIGTLGFRGEALAAISAVSHIELLTRPRGASSGTRVALDAGDIESMSPAGCPDGTTMVVRDIFFNTPARLKFMKSDKAEAAFCLSAAKRCALARPDVSVRLIRDGREEFFSPGDGKPESAVYALLGREFAVSMLPCSTDDGGVRVSGFISSPSMCRGSRGMQFFFCNGRPIRSQTLQAALEQAYKNSLMTGRFPACVLSIELSFAAVDVNVHPTKAEVKFSDEKRVFDGVYYAALAALDGETTPKTQVRLPDETIPAPRTAQAVPKRDFFLQMPAEQFRSAAVSSGAAFGRGGDTSKRPSGTREKLPALSVRQPKMHYGQSAPEAPSAAATPAVSPAETLPDPADGEMRIIGEALGTYIIVEKNGSLTLIDKHAAHERIIFDRLKECAQAPMSQSLIIPVTVNTGPESAERLIENAPALSELGFETELFGDDAVIIRAVPSGIDPGDVPAVIEEISENLRRGAAAASPDEILHTVACKAAIKAGRSSEPQELIVLAQRVMDGDIKYCPHGRPVCVTLTKKELDRYFKRI